MSGAESKAAALLEALPYIQKFKGQIVVVKYGGAFMDADDHAGRNRVALDIVFLQAVGVRPVVVHGGGKAIGRALESAGIDFRFVKGQRVTDAKSVKVVERVLSREINPEIVATLQSFGAKAKGFSGTAIFTCRKMEITDEHGEPFDLGFVGDITDVDTRAIKECLEQGQIPVISPTARHQDGSIYNCNADVATAHAAMALKAPRLVFMSDVPGLMRDPSDPATLLSRLSLKEIELLRSERVIERGMIPKVESAAKAIRAGVEKVSFIDGRAEHSLLVEIFTNTGQGTEVVA